MFYPDNEYHIRQLTEADLAQVCSIEKRAYTIAWTDKVHAECVESGYPSLILKQGGAIVGYAIFNYLYDECHLMNIVTDPNFQGLGVATRLIKAMYDKARKSGMVKVILEVRESNTIAIEFYHKQGFAEIGLRKNYYKTTDGQEDALVMELIL
ncbi:ribosomal protein S18-alanine N-acetyltransferase [Kangiella koreensis]|uniref:[Ribosomal protein bS18]-alanine N-acetyltransferase n=1 Tax=Kangiella koreensis (strain DSM 16069 / JCM 12317 / KCTC 12182 / SW-125) TaxID=523791 RepID=C7RAA3_KANKD|nr:ribosomal protein S18-alanine N-acetyltransferase [Kangiella koreensis]ACV26222.1 ribosomal-protein-alanine acetyltransferase [Kangiella koreensis DSM 16069]